MVVIHHKLCIHNDELKDKISILTFIHEYLTNVKENEDICSTKCIEYVMVKGKGMFMPTMVIEEVKTIMKNLGE